MTRRFRWAPTPSGPLHLGNLFSMILTWLEARSSGSELLLRIDDLDFSRTRAEYVAEIFELIGALGLDWDLGPLDFQQFERQYSQKYFQDLYKEFFDRARGLAPELFFVCDCTRKQLGGAEAYSGRCRSRNLDFKSDGSCVWRVRSDNLCKEWMLQGGSAIGDCVIFRKEGFFAYQWVSLVDDIRWGITDVIRGEDLRSSSLFQLALAKTLSDKGLEDFSRFVSIQFHHHPLIFGGARKLSKSEGAQAVKGLLDNPKLLLRIFAKWMNFEKQDFTTPRELLDFYTHQKKGARLYEVSKVWQLDELLG